MSQGARLMLGLPKLPPTRPHSRAIAMALDVGTTPNVCGPARPARPGLLVLRAGCAFTLAGSAAAAAQGIMTQQCTPKRLSNSALSVRCCSDVDPLVIGEDRREAHAEMGRTFRLGRCADQQIRSFDSGVYGWSGRL